GPERDLRGHDTVAAVESLLGGEHVHRAALALGVAAAPSGQFGHHTLRVHAAGQHVAVVAIAGDDLVAGLERHLHADDTRFLAGVEGAEAADQAHAVELPRLFLEAADQQHVAERAKFLFLAERRYRVILRRTALGRGGLAGNSHVAPQKMALGSRSLA